MKAILSRLGRAGGRSRATLAVAPSGGGIEALRDAILDRGLDADLALALGDALETEGRCLEAVEALSTANRLRRDPSIERRLVRLRHAAFAELDRSLGVPPWPPAFVPEDRPGTEGPPRITPQELTPGALRNGILRHGCLWVRGLIDPSRVKRLVRTIDRAFEAYDAAAAGRATPATAPYYDAFEGMPSGAEMRRWVREGNGVLATDSPRALFEFLETIRELRIDQLITSYLGERAALSAEKCTLRRVDATAVYADWHQDGAFLGKGIRTVNAWCALSECGKDAPGLEILPIRIDRLLPTGQKGAIFDWAVSPETIARELPIWRPEFAPGDVLFFDHLFLHRTSVAPSMTRLRYAIESWFFAASAYPGDSTPILV
jgi:hypothetical protein